MFDAVSQRELLDTRSRRLGAPRPFFRRFRGQSLQGAGHRLRNPWRKDQTRVAEDDVGVTHVHHDRH